MKLFTFSLRILSNRDHIEILDLILSQDVKVTRQFPFLVFIFKLGYKLARIRIFSLMSLILTNELSWWCGNECHEKGTGYLLSSAMLYLQFHIFHETRITIINSMYFTQTKTIRVFENELQTIYLSESRLELSNCQNTKSKSLRNKIKSFWSDRIWWFREWNLQLH